MFLATRRRLLLDRSFRGGLPLLLAALLLCAPLSAEAQEVPSPNTLSQQGLLTDDQGNPLNGSFEMTFSILNGEESLFSETQNVEVIDGRYNVQIGDDTQFSDEMFFPEETFKKVPDHFLPSGTFFPDETLLRTEVEGETLSPDRPLSSTPYAFLASGLFNEGNLPIVTDGNASIHVNNDASGEAGQFAIFRGEGTTPFLRINDNSEGTPQMVVPNGIVASDGGGFRLPDGTVLDEQSDLGQLSLPFSGSESTSNPVFEVGNSDSGPAIRASNGDIEVATGDVVLSDGTRLGDSEDLGGLSLPFSDTSSASDPLLDLAQTSSGGVGRFVVDNSDSDADALLATTNGTNVGTAIKGVQNGLGIGARVEIDNSNNDRPALRAETNGGGIGVFGLQTGTGPAGYFQILNSSSDADALEVTTDGTGSAGDFRTTNSNSDATALKAETNGTGAALDATTIGTGNAGRFEIDNSNSEADAIRGETNGLGDAIRAEAKGVGDAIDGFQTGSAGEAGSFETDNPNNPYPALRAKTNGFGPAGEFTIDNPASAAAAVRATTNGLNFAARFQIENSDNDSPALRATTDGTGFVADLTASQTGTGAGDNPAGNVARIANFGGQGADVLALQAGLSNPTDGVNYLSFYDENGNSVGAVEGNGSGGVRYKTSGSDYAEALPVVKGEARPEPNDLVGVRGGAVSLSTEGANRLMVVTDRAAVLGNVSDPDAEAARQRVPVAFIGQVPARVRGPVQVGDLIVASGQEDGTARPVSPSEYSHQKHGPIAGQAWSAKSTSDVGTVTVAVGLDQSGTLAMKLAEERRRNDRQQKRLARLEKRLTTLEAQPGGSVLAGLPGAAGLLLGLLLGGALGAGLLWRRRA